MPAPKSAKVQDAASARQILLDGITHGLGVVEALERLAPLHHRNNTFPSEVFIRLATDALDWGRGRPG